MADEAAVTGVDDQAAENFYDPDQTAELSGKVETLEQEKLKLVAENEETKERIKKLTVEMEKLKSAEAELKERLRETEKEIESFEEDKKALGAIAGRAAELETEVSRLQHDLITAMAEVDAASAEAAAKGARIESLESEVESLRAAKAEGEKRVRELERKIGVLEVKEIEERSKRIRAEEETREQIGEQERQIVALKKIVEELEAQISENGVEAEKWVKEKVSVELALRQSEEKAKKMESKVHLLQKEVEKAETVIRGVKDQTVKVVNGEVDEVFGGGQEKGLNLRWPVIAGSVAAVVAGAAVLCVIHGRHR
ncbi:Peroxisomal and mitochondrial division factor [Parasponia andersonii]|uniref:Peroxisomal and mitochondrial division factor n=1 Tax=Parasponia andersonii TaxID=3476 RepID=A0A2P5D827_PARAD|nr:Peroxisomal and mitochondrial division factor [Parasponia andersonii]